MRQIGRRRGILWIVIGMLLLYDCFRLPLHARTNWADDFAGYWTCGQVFLAGGNPYSPEAVAALQRTLGRVEEPLIMWSPPWVYVLILPFLIVPFTIARTSWFLFNLGLLIWAADYLWRCYAGCTRDRWIAWMAAVLFVPNALALNLGQITPLLVASSTAFLWAVLSKRELLAGVALLPIAAKPHLFYLFLIFLVLWVVKEKQWRLLLGTGIALTLCGAAVLLVDAAAYSDYVRAVLSGSGPYIWQTPTATTALRMLFPDHAVAAQLLPPIVGVVLGCVLWFKWRGEFSWHSRVFPILLLSLMTTPYSWTADLAIMFPAALVIIIRRRALPRQNMWWFWALVASQIVVAVLVFSNVNYFVLVWLAPTIATLYWLSCRSATGSGWKSVS